MKYKFSYLLFMTMVISIVFLSGCGAARSANSSAQTQDPTSIDTSSITPETDQPSTSTLVNPATFSASESMSASWIDAKSDLMSPSDANLDGIMDGHFHLTLQLPQPIVLESIFIRYSEFGKELRWDGVYNTHLTPAGYTLAVYENGSLIPPGPDTGIKKSGQVDLDLFAAGLNNAKGRDTFSFDPGSHFQIELNYTTQTGELMRWSSNLTS